RPMLEAVRIEKSPALGFPLRHWNKKPRVKKPVVRKIMTYACNRTHQLTMIRGRPRYPEGYRIPVRGDGTKTRRAGQTPAPLPFYGLLQKRRTQKAQISYQGSLPAAHIGHPASALSPDCTQSDRKLCPVA